MSIYHINPKTGMPSICHAKQGNCPYDKEDHYAGYSEAFLASQERMREEHNLLPVSEDDFKTNYVDKYSLPEDEVELKEYIRHTDDVELLKDIIKGRLFIEDGWDKVSVALQNPNVPREFIDDVIYDNPEEYTLETRRWIMLNDSLTHEDIMYVVNNSEDLYARSIALKNPNIDVEFAEDFLRNRKEDVRELPWSQLTQNRAVDPDVIREYDKWSSSIGDPFYSLNFKYLTKNYSDWMRTHERNQRFN